MTKPLTTAYVALGANLGDAQAAVRQAIEALHHLPGTAVVRSSSLYLSPPLSSHAELSGAALGLDYINAAVEINTSLTAPALLEELQKLEQAAGRERPYPDAPRTLDLDFLIYGSTRMQSEQLVLPHPRMWQRAFVLVPLHEIAPQLVTATQLQAVAGQRIERVAPTR